VPDADRKMTAQTLLERVRAALAPRYRVDDELGSGGMAVVYRARDTRLGRDVAVKVLRPEHATAALVARFRREARILAALHHPGVVPIHDDGEADGLSYYVMELVAGESLAARLERGPLSPAGVRALGLQLLDALAAVHERGIVHRDLKPSNILLDRTRAIVVDFGVSRAPSLESTSSDTEAGRVVGTPAYMAPEQFAGSATALTDIYACGAALYQAATGRLWEPGLTGPLAWSGVPASLRRAIERSLQLDPAGRWESAAAFRRALARRRPRVRLVAPAAAAILLLVGWAGGEQLFQRLGLLPGWWPPPFPAAAAPLTPPARSDLAIVPFDWSASPGAGRQLARYTTERIEWFPRLSVVPAIRVAGADGRAEAARRAGRYVEGEVRQAAGSPVLHLVVRDSAHAFVDDADVPGDTAQLAEWSLAAADSIVAITAPPYLEQFRELARRATRNLPAIRALVAGEDAFRLDNWGEAERQFRAALAADPGYPAALWMLALLHRWRREPYEPEIRALAAVGADELPDPWRAIVAAQLEPDLPRRLETFRELAARSPHSDIANFFYLNELFHRGALTGHPLDSTMQLIVAERGNPYVADALADQTVWGFIRLGDRTGARRALARRLDLAVRVGRASESGDRAALLRLAYLARFAPHGSRIGAYLALRGQDESRRAVESALRFGGLPFDVPEIQSRIAAALMGEREGSLGTLHAARAVALGAMGQVRAALSELDAVPPTPGLAEADLQRWEWRAILPTLGLPGVPERETERASVELARLAERATARSAWARALLARSRRDTAALAGAHRSLHAAPASPTRDRLDGILEALVLADAGDTTGALVRSAALATDDSGGRVGGPFARAVLHLSRGQWLLGLGRDADADREFLWYENSDFAGWPDREPQAGEIDAMLSPLARVYRAEIALRLGDRAGARRMAERALELWSDADEAFGPLKARASAAAQGHR
jgi:tetratricopeptide (TPR) repeat protein